MGQEYIKNISDYHLANNYDTVTFKGNKKKTGWGVIISINSLFFNFVQL